METIAISIFGNRISSRLDVSEKLMIVTTENDKIKTRDTILLESTDILKKLDTLLKLKPDVLICGGLTNLCKKMLSNYNIKVIPWVKGDTELILKLYLKGLLVEKNKKNFSEDLKWKLV
jgi:predicted Fe-Mo cluster-binding NifX family protein